jgi:hypothetical protein
MDARRQNTFLRIDGEPTSEEGLCALRGGKGLAHGWLRAWTALMDNTFPTPPRNGTMSLSLSPLDLRSPHRVLSPRRARPRTSNGKTHLSSKQCPTQKFALVDMHSGAYVFPASDHHHVSFHHHLACQNDYFMYPGGVAPRHLCSNMSSTLQPQNFDIS